MAYRNYSNLHLTKKGSFHETQSSRHGCLSPTNRSSAASGAEPRGPPAASPCWRFLGAAVGKSTDSACSAAGGRRPAAVRASSTVEAFGVRDGQVVDKGLLAARNECQENGDLPLHVARVLILITVRAPLPESAL